jgi:hypothetical protein
MLVILEMLEGLLAVVVVAVEQEALAISPRGL